MSESLAAPTTPAPVKGGVVPYLTVDGVAAAAEFYKQAFAAEEAVRMPPDPQGRYMHCHLYINGGSVMLSDPFPDHGHPWEPPQGFSLTLQVDDVDAWFERAVKAGATPVQPPADMFWGDRYAQARDPFGVLWAINGPKL
jgi:uncharacterized glyoxalase superfamily protein PhnB